MIIIIVMENSMKLDFYITKYLGVYTFVMSADTMSFVGYIDRSIYSYLPPPSRRYTLTLYIYIQFHFVQVERNGIISSTAK